MPRVLEHPGAMQERTILDSGVEAGMRLMQHQAALEQRNLTDPACGDLNGGPFVVDDRQLGIAGAVRSTGDVTQIEAGDPA